MKENIRIGIIKWFGGYNTKRNKSNNGGVVTYLQDKTSEWLSIHEFSDETKNISSLKYRELGGKLVLSFEENQEKFVYLLNDEKVFSVFTDNEILDLLKNILNQKDYCIEILGLIYKNNENIYQTFNKIFGILIKCVITRNLDFLNDYDEIIKENDNIFEYISMENLIKYFTIKKDYFNLYKVAERVNINSDYNFGEEENEKKSDLLIKEISPETLKSFKEFSETIELFRNILCNANVDTIYRHNEIPKQKWNLELLENTEIEEIEKYIREEIKFEDSSDIKSFIDYAAKYSFSSELEDCFIKEILEVVEKELKGSYSIKKYLSYFDGTIIFNKDENNKSYNELRKKLLFENNLLGSLIKDKLLHLNEKNEKFCKIIKKVEGDKVFYNRYYYSGLSRKDPHYEYILNRNIYEVFNFKSGNDIVKALNFLLSFYETKMSCLNSYEYTLITVPSSKQKDTRGLENFVKFVCLLTGIKNGFNIIRADYSKNLKSKKEGGDGIIGNIICGKVKTKYAIIFDDVYTHGETISYCSKQLIEKNLGLNIPFCMAFSVTSHHLNKGEFLINENAKGIWFVVLKIKYQYSSQIEEIPIYISKKVGETLEEAKKDLSIKKEIIRHIPLKNLNYNNEYQCHFYDSEGAYFSYIFYR